MHDSFTIEEKNHLIDMIATPEEYQLIERDLARYLLLFGDNEELVNIGHYLIDFPGEEGEDA